MKTIRFVKRISEKPNRPVNRPSGFALVVTLSLMILLTVIAVGLLTLSSISLRSASQGDSMQTARANARMALMLAIGDLQKHMGPDQRVSTAADQRTTGTDASQTSSAATNRQWTGVYRSWAATSNTRPSPEFVSWLVSGDPTKITQEGEAKTAATGNNAVELVGIGTLGDLKYGQVTVPAVNVTRTGGKPARLAWWVGDQGIKAAVATPPPSIATAFGPLRNSLQGAPRNAVELASNGTVKPFEKLAADDTRLNLVTSWKQSAFLASDIPSPRGLFHDLAPFSTGLLTNVRTGGFRKDLSMALERPFTSAPKTELYKVGNENGINLQELWAYYNLPKELNWSGGSSFTTGGGRIAARTPSLMLESSPAACQSDEWFFYKQPVIISYQMVMSLETRTVQVVEAGQTKTKYRVHVVADPILTFWNPLDVPVTVPVASYFSVKYWQIPYDFDITVNGANRRRFPVAATLSGAKVDAAGKISTGDGNYLSLIAGRSQQLVFKPGEVIKVSQSGNTTIGKIGDHALEAKAGFNYGGGVSLPVRDISGATLDVNPADVIAYEVRPNNYTAGKSASSGNWIPGVGLNHTRHFSLTHHECYIGNDRSNNADGSDTGTSLGYGGMYIDWDFGNRRLKPSEDRGQRQPGIAGTKPSTERLYADRFPQIFKTIGVADARPLVAQDILLHKEPFMLLSYHAKTENGSDSGTRFLSRFNPKAHHIDFYNLSPAERDILPYEFSVEPLVSWKNRSLEVSTNGNAYFGGSMNAQFGNSFVTTHSVPREPIVSLAAFQHSFANGFDMFRPRYGYAILNTREPMMPQVAHAIGNSVAPPMMAPDKTDGTLPGGRPMADHSYLANRALWDDWFLSSIAPQNSNTHGKTTVQKTVASDFFSRKDFTSEKGRLPIVRYLPDLDGQDAVKLVNSLFAGSVPNDSATLNVGSYLRVDGLFNVNSTSIEAWKAMLGSLKGRQVVVRSINGDESVAPADTNTPVANLSSPQNLIAKGNGNVDVKSPEQWVGRRVLSDEDIDKLARALVKEVRKRGPFLSLADFVNRRVGSDKQLARSGAIQSALDSDESGINTAYNSNRAVSTTATSRFPFPEAEEGALAFGSPGIVKQADILTPIAPVLSVRSDSFIIRAYGEAVDAAGKVTARAWCEAVVERDRNFVDPADTPETVLTNLTKNVNGRFGRRYELVSYRWLSPGEI